MIPPELYRHPLHQAREALAEELMQLLPGSCEIRRAAVEALVEDPEAIAEAHEHARDEGSG